MVFVHVICRQNTLYTTKEFCIACFYIDKVNFAITGQFQDMARNSANQRKPFIVILVPKYAICWITPPQIFWGGVIFFFMNFMISCFIAFAQLPRFLILPRRYHLENVCRSKPWHLVPMIAGLHHNHRYHCCPM